MNYISLGYFCSVASELERYGLRGESYPFDWVISDFGGVVEAIQNNFSNFLDYDFLAQSSLNHSVYENTKYNIRFFHDFDKYIPLKKQLPQVQDKYCRRIKRFYQTIVSPTLFIRYISDEKTIHGVSEELVYIEKNYEQILEMLKSFHRDNDILFIAHGGVESSKFNIYHVPKDDNDVVARTPFSANPDLHRKFSQEEIPDKQKNIERCLKKEKVKRKLCSRIKRKSAAALKNVFLKEYIHEKQF